MQDIYGSIRYKRKQHQSPDLTGNNPFINILRQKKNNQGSFPGNRSENHLLRGITDKEIQHKKK